MSAVRQSSSFLLLGFLCIGHCLTDAYNTICIDLQPENVFAVEGDTVLLTCTLSCNISGTIHFGMIINSSNVGIKSDDVVKLSASSSGLALRNVRVSTDGTKIYCRADDMTSYYTHIYVFRQLQIPVLHRCVVFNWQSMSCSWIPSNHFQKEHTRDHQLITEVTWSCNRTSSWQRCPRSSIEWRGDWLTWNNVTIDGVYCMHMTVTSRFMNASVLSKVVCVKPLDNVQPAAPTDVTHTAHNATYVVIRWKTNTPPNLNAALTYRITVTSYWQQDNPLVLEVINTDSIVLPISDPWTVHRVTIQVRPSGSGYWSDPSVPYEFLSPPSAPRRQPTVAPHFYSSHSDAVFIYWKSVPVQYRCGSDFYYQVVAIKRSGLRVEAGVRVNGNDTLVSLSTTWLQTYNVDSLAVIACNDQGPATQNHSSVNVSSAVAADSIRHHLSAEGRDKTIQVYWSRSRYNTSSERVKSLTIYWCLTGFRRKLRTCVGEIDWRTISMNQRSTEEFEYSLSVFGDFSWYQVGVAVNNHSIEWAECINSANGSLIPPNDVTLFAVTPDLSGGKLQVKWSEPDCKQVHQRTSSFVISYCIVSKDHECTGKLHELSLLANHKSGSSRTYILNGLDQDATYGVRVFSCSKLSRSQGSLLAVARTTSFWMSSAAIAGITFGCFVIVCMGIFAVIFNRRLWKRCKEKFEHKYRIAIAVPKASEDGNTKCGNWELAETTQYDHEMDKEWRQTPNDRLTASRGTNGLSCDSGYDEDIKQTASPTDVMTSLLLTSGQRTRRTSTVTCGTLESDVFTDDEQCHSPIETHSDESLNYVKLNDVIGLAVAGRLMPSSADFVQHCNKDCPQLFSERAINGQQLTETEPVTAPVTVRYDNIFSNTSTLESQQLVASNVPTECDDVTAKCRRQLSDNVQRLSVDQYIPHAMLLDASS